LAKKIIVVGAGASGLIAAGIAASNGAEVLLLEKMERAGRKLLITGKGRCNITNIASVSDYNHHIHPRGNFLRPAFAAFFSDNIIELLKQHGVKSKIERGGRVFPESDQSKDVVNGLLRWLNNNNTKIEYNCKVNKILTKENKVIGLVYEKNDSILTKECDAVVLCTGGKSYPATGSDGNGYLLAKELGHYIVPPFPSLVPLVTEGTFTKALQGLSLKNVKASVWVEGKKAADEFGEMLFTHYGLSGPIILTLSRLAVKALNENKEVYISIDLKPALDDKTLDNRLLRDFNSNGKKQISNIFRELLPSGMIIPFLHEIGIPSEKQGNQISAEERKKIRLLLKNLKFSVSGHRGYKEAIITSGGINLDEVNSKTMESRLVKNLFFAGEILDLNADTGGYNLQIAWSTGYLAGQSAADSKN